MTQKATGGERPLNWPDDAESVTAADIDFEALAHVLANTCRRGGCMRGYHSVAAHAVAVSEEIEALDGLADEDRRALALHALVADAPSAWLRRRLPDSQRAVERTGKLATGIETAVREAAGLGVVLDEEGAELLRFLSRMAAAAGEPRPLGRERADRRRGRLPAAEAAPAFDPARQGGAGLARPVQGAGRAGGRAAPAGRGECRASLTWSGAGPPDRCPGQGAGR